MNVFVRSILVACGTLCVALGFVGVIVPGLPTTPFLLLAAWCYARSSERFYRWLLANRWFGEYIRNYQEGRGMQLRHKVLALTLMWATMGWTIVNIVPVWWGKLMLLAVAVGVTIYLLRIRTFRPGARNSECNATRVSDELDFDRK